MKFPPDYPIESLRGESRLTPARRRRALEERARWLEAKIEERTKEKGPYSDFAPIDLYVKELAAIAQSLEELEGLES